MRTLLNEHCQIHFSKKNLPRAEYVTWFLVKGKLKIGGILLNLNLLDEIQARCAFCCDEIETASHLFFYL